MKYFSGLKNKPDKWQVVFVMLWISFLLSGMATGLLFSIIDPALLNTSTGFFTKSSTAIYSIGFLLLWALAFSSSYISYLFVNPNEI